MHDDDTLTGLDKAGRARQHRGTRPVFSSRGAIYHFSARTGNRSKGHSARAAAAYIQREEEYERGRGLEGELVYAESGHMPRWAEDDPSIYWRAADEHERANGRLFKGVEVALPTALTPAEQRELAVGFARHLTEAEQLPYTLALHAGKGTNPHAHLLISERGNDGLERSPELWFRRYNAAEPERGGARKSRELKPRAWLDEARAAWAEQTNLALERGGHEVRVDHRTLEEQGITRAPGLHLGPAVSAMEARGIETDRGNEARAVARADAALRRAYAALDAEQARELDSHQEAEYERARAEQEREPGGAGVEREGGDVGGHAGRAVGRGGDDGLFLGRAGEGDEAGDRGVGEGDGEIQAGVVGQGDRGATRADSEPGRRAAEVEQEQARAREREEDMERRQEQALRLIEAGRAAARAEKQERARTRELERKQERGRERGEDFELEP